MARSSTVIMSGAPLDQNQLKAVLLRQQGPEQTKTTTASISKNDQPTIKAALAKQQIEKKPGLGTFLGQHLALNPLDSKLLATKTKGEEVKQDPLMTRSATVVSLSKPSEVKSELTKVDPLQKNDPKSLAGSQRLPETSKNLNSSEKATPELSVSKNIPQQSKQNGPADTFIHRKSTESNLLQKAIIKENEDLKPRTNTEFVKVSNTSGQNKSSLLEKQGPTNQNISEQSAISLGKGVLKLTSSKKLFESSSEESSPSDSGSDLEGDDMENSLIQRPPKKLEASLPKADEQKSLLSESLKASITLSNSSGKDAFNSLQGSQISSPDATLKTTNDNLSISSSKPSHLILSQDLNVSQIITSESSKEIVQSSSIHLSQPTDSVSQKSTAITQSIPDPQTRSRNNSQTQVVERNDLLQKLAKVSANETSEEIVPNSSVQTQIEPRNNEQSQNLSQTTSSTRKMSDRSQKLSLRPKGKSINVPQKYDQKNVESIEYIDELTHTIKSYEIKQNLIRQNRSQDPLPKSIISDVKKITHLHAKDMTSSMAASFRPPNDPLDIFDDEEREVFASFHKERSTVKLVTTHNPHKATYRIKVTQSHIMTDISRVLCPEFDKIFQGLVELNYGEPKAFLVILHFLNVI